MRTARRRYVSRGTRTRRKLRWERALSTPGFTIAANTTTTQNLLAGVEAYEGFNIIGTVLRIIGCFAVDTLAVSQGQFAVAIGVLPSGYAIPNGGLRGNQRYLDWMYYTQRTGPNIAAAAANDWAQSGLYYWEIDLRSKRKLSKPDDQLSLVVDNGQAAVVGYSTTLNVLVAT